MPAEWGRKSDAHSAKETFTALEPDDIVLLTEKPDVIVERRKQRDNIDHNVDEIKRFQDEETAYAAEVAEALGIR